MLNRRFYIIVIRYYIIDIVSFVKRNNIIILQRYSDILEIYYYFKYVFLKLKLVFNISFGNHYA